MKKLAIFCVTYHSYKELKLYLTSIDKAASKVVESLSVDVFIADNTETDFRQIDYLDKFYYIKCFIFPFYKNMGYFGGIQQVMKSVDFSSYDYTTFQTIDTTEQTITIPLDGLISILLYNGDEELSRKGLFCVGRTSQQDSLLGKCGIK